MKITRSALVAFWQITGLWQSIVKPIALQAVITEIEYKMSQPQGRGDFPWSDAWDYDTSVTILQFAFRYIIVLHNGHRRIGLEQRIEMTDTQNNYDICSE